MPPKERRCVKGKKKGKSVAHAPEGKRERKKPRPRKKDIDVVAIAEEKRRGPTLRVEDREEKGEKVSEKGLYLLKRKKGGKLQGEMIFTKKEVPAFTHRGKRGKRGLKRGEETVLLNSREKKKKRYCAVFV